MARQQDYSQTYQSEMLGAVNAQANVLPQAAAKELNISGDLQRAQNAMYEGQAQSTLGLYGTIGAMSQGMQQQEITSQVNMLGAASQQGTQAYMQSMPAWASGSANAFGNYAMQQMQLGSSLGAEDQAYATQNARAAYAARGMQYGNQAIGSEILNNYNLGQQRLQQRMGYAQQAFGMGQQIQQAGYQMYATPAYDQSQMYSKAGLLASAQAGMQTLGPQFLTPESQYLANIRSNAIQQQNANAAAAAQNKAGQMAAGGAIAGAAIIAI